MRGQRLQVALMERGIGIFLRVDDPDEEVDELDQAIRLEPVGEVGGVLVGEIKQDQTIEFVLAAGIEDRLVSELVTPRDTEPVKQWLCTVRTPHAGKGMCGRGAVYSGS